VVLELREPCIVVLIPVEKKEGREREKNEGAESIKI